MTPADKERFADEAHKAVDHETVQAVMEEFADNMGFKLDGLPAYGLTKVAHYAAIVARAQALGISPDELRYTPAESRSAILEQAANMVYRGIPTRIIEGDR